jgi:hypothetical protein
MTADPDIAAYYERGKEQRRLAEWGRLERLRTLELLERHLPPRPPRCSTWAVVPARTRSSSPATATRCISSTPWPSTSSRHWRRRPTRRSPPQGFLLEPGFEEVVARDVAEGQHRNPDHHPNWFTTAYFHRPDELEREVAGAGFDVRALLAVEGPVGAHGEVGVLDAWLDDPAKRELLMRAITRVEAEPSLLGASPHVMAIATRP